MGGHVEIKANFHTHMMFSDGKNTAEEVVLQALSLGFAGLGFSDHLDPEIPLDTKKYFEEIHRLQGVYGDRIDILAGVELDVLKDPSEAAGAQYVIGSVHYLDLDTEMPKGIDCSEDIIKNLADHFYGGDYYRLAKAYYDLEAQVYDRTKCTFIGHFDLVTRFNDSMHFLDEEDPRYVKPALEAMEYLVTKGVPFEINCGAVNRGRKAELYPNLFLLRKLCEMGGEIVISSDAHQKELLNGAFDIAVERAVACGFTHTNILSSKDGAVYWRQVALK